MAYGAFASDTDMLNLYCNNVYFNYNGRTYNLINALLATGLSFASADEEEIIVVEEDETDGEQNNGENDGGGE